MAIVDDFFKFRPVSHTHAPDLSTRPAADIGLLGADLQSALLPVKIEIRQLARRMHGDLHGAAMHLLTQRHSRRLPMLEQQLVVTALQQIEDASDPACGT